MLLIKISYTVYTYCFIVADLYGDLQSPYRSAARILSSTYKSRARNVIVNYHYAFYIEKGLGKLLQKKKTEPSPFEGNKNVDTIANSMKDSRESEALEMQWKHAANILTRFMSLVYILAITITFFAIVLNKEDYGHVFPKQK